MKVFLKRNAKIAKSGAFDVSLTGRYSYEQPSDSILRPSFTGDADSEYITQVIIFFENILFYC